MALVPPIAGMLRAPAPPVKPSRLPWALRREEERNRRQGIFDGAFYLEKYPDVRAAGLDPLRHYVEYGAAEGRKPHRLFDPAYYLRQRPEARAAGVDPLVDFLEGGATFANPHPLFDCAATRSGWWITSRQNIWRGRARNRSSFPMNRSIQRRLSSGRSSRPSAPINCEPEIRNRDRARSALVR